MTLTLLGKFLSSKSSISVQICNTKGLLKVLKLPSDGWPTVVCSLPAMKVAILLTFRIVRLMSSVPITIALNWSISTCDHSATRHVQSSIAYTFKTADDWKLHSDHIQAHHFVCLLETNRFVFLSHIACNILILGKVWSCCNEGFHSVSRGLILRGFGSISFWLL